MRFLHPNKKPVTLYSFGNWLSNYNRLANDVRVLSGERTLDVYNMKGGFVCRLKGTRLGDVQSKLNSMKLEKGLYVVKKGSFNKIFSVK